MTDEQQQIGISPGQAVWWGVRFIGWGVLLWFGILFLVLVLFSVNYSIQTLFPTPPPRDTKIPCEKFVGGKKVPGLLETQPGVQGSGQCYPIDPEAGSFK